MRELMQDGRGDHPVIAARQAPLADRDVLVIAMGGPIRADRDRRPEIDKEVIPLTIVMKRIALGQTLEVFVARIMKVYLLVKIQNDTASELRLLEPGLFRRGGLGKHVIFDNQATTIGFRTISVAGCGCIDLDMCAYSPF